MKYLEKQLGERDLILGQMLLELFTSGIGAILAAVAWRLSSLIWSMDVAILLCLRRWWLLAE